MAVIISLTNVVHVLHVSPFIEPEEKNKDCVQKQWERAISIPVVLPVTPKIGDSIEIPFVKTSYSYSTDDKYQYGFVHEIIHTIRGTMQEINIYDYSGQTEPSFRLKLSHPILRWI